MQPGEKTRAPLRLRESDQVHAPAHLRLTAVFRPGRIGIGASMKLGTFDSSGIMRLTASVFGRNALIFRDDQARDEPRVCRHAPILSHYSKISLAAIAQRLKLLGALK